MTFASIMAASPVSTFANTNKAASTYRQDDKNKPSCKEHHDCSKHAKGECKKGMMSDSTKHCTKGHHGKKSCCKKGATPATPVTPAK